MDNKLLELVKDHLKVEYSNLFKLSKLNEVFKAFAPVLSSFDHDEYCICAKHKLRFKYNESLYLAKVYTERVDDLDHETIYNLRIILPNGIFIYSDKFRAKLRNIKRNKSNTWILLEGCYEDEFKDIIEFCIKRFKNDRLIQTKIFYNEKDQMTDIVIKNCNNYITITFKEFYSDVDFY
jgi:hypothetical protein